MEIEVYTIEQLARELTLKDFWFQNVAPITKHRARLVINNPRSDKKDPVLFVARKEKEIIGYRLIFPDKIFINGDFIKIGWGSSFWVDDKYRGQGIGRKLFEKSLELWRGNIGSLIQSDDAARLYEGNSNFYCFSKVTGYQFIIRFSSFYWVTKKISLHSSFKLFFSIVDFPINLGLKVLHFKWNSFKRPLENLHLEYVTEISDTETMEFIHRNNQSTLLRKEAEDLNTMVKYPTSISTPFDDCINSRYLFTTKAARFDYFFLKVFSIEMELIGVMLMNVEGDGIKLLYYFCNSQESMIKLFNVFLAHAIKLNVKVINSYDNAFNVYLKNGSRFPTIYGRKRIRKSFFPLHLKLYNIQEFKIYDGDGA